MSRGFARRSRCLSVWMVASLAAGVAWWAAAPEVGGLSAQLTAASRFDDALVGVSALALLAAVAWLWLLTTLTVVQVLADRAPRRAGTARRLVLLACGVALSAGVASPALAHGGSDTGLAGLALPDRAVSSVATPRAAHPAPPNASPASAPTATVRVRPGDTLWAIAAATARPGEHVDDRWRAIWSANRDVIGPDPDLILPGQQLSLPTTPSTHE